MSWTKKAPTKEGWYWVRDLPDDNIPWPHRFYKGFNSGTWFVVVGDIDQKWSDLCRDGYQRWHDPITPPSQRAKAKEKRNR